MNYYELLYYYRMDCWHYFKKIETVYAKLVYKAIHHVCYNFSSLCFTVSDCYQEALIYVVDALSSYREDLQTNLSSYVYQAVIMSTRLLQRKHRLQSYGLLDRSLSLSFPLTSDESLYLEDIVCEPRVWYNPTQMAALQEKYVFVNQLLESLSTLEKQVFLYRNDGYSYEEIAHKLKITSKKVDNVLYKIRSLAKKHYQ